VYTGVQDTVRIVKTSLALGGLGAEGKRETPQVFDLVDLETPFEDWIVQLPPHIAGGHHLDTCSGPRLVSPKESLEAKIGGCDD
jgi:hypothetical protein